MSKQDTAPSPNGDNGERDAGGRFAKGNPGGPGNPFARRTAALRVAVLGAVSAEDVRAIVRKLVKMAKAGNLAAIREVLNRTIGNPVDAPDPDRLDLDEASLAGDLNTADMVRAVGTTGWDHDAQRAAARLLMARAAAGDEAALRAIMAAEAGAGEAGE